VLGFGFWEKKRGRKDVKIKDIRIIKTDHRQSTTKISANKARGFFGYYKCEMGAIETWRDF